MYTVLPIGGFGLTGYGAVAVAFLILLLAMKEIISVTEFYNETVRHSLNAAAAPLLIMFAVIVAVKTIEILY